MSYNLLQSFLDYKFHSTVKTDLNKAGVVAGTVAVRRGLNTLEIWAVCGVHGAFFRVAHVLHVSAPGSAVGGFLSSGKTNATDRSTLHSHPRSEPTGTFHTQKPLLSDQAFCGLPATAPATAQQEGDSGQASVL